MVVEFAYLLETKQLNVVSEAIQGWWHRIKFVRNYCGNWHIYPLLVL